MATKAVHRLQSRPKVDNQGHTPYLSPKLPAGPCSSVGMRWWTDTHRQTHRRAWPICILRRLIKLINTGQFRMNHGYGMRRAKPRRLAADI